MINDKIKYNKYIPFKGFLLINLYGTYYVNNRDKNITIHPFMLNHEAIHDAQANDINDLLYIKSKNFL